MYPQKIKNYLLSHNLTVDHREDRGFREWPVKCILLQYSTQCTMYTQYQLMKALKSFSILDFHINMYMFIEVISLHSHKTSCFFSQPGYCSEIWDGVA